ncbi:hypothetical protein CEXT_383801 [Caerostris extrusa]|uniref:Uncharacterized protein n=1 Tax=Caerostris extrusa TaxID=172846 RepID=A0AAV4P6Q1_CAEEX|nr:hypothetical protein CEXT_383801 [Caerostris extrusa]
MNGLGDDKSRFNSTIRLDMWSDVALRDCVASSIRPQGAALVEWGDGIVSESVRGIYLCCRGETLAIAFAGKKSFGTSFEVDNLPSINGYSYQHCWWTFAELNNTSRNCMCPNGILEVLFFTCF